MACFLIPPFSTVRATFTAHGSTPAVLLHSLRYEASLRISPAYTGFPVHSLRVRWVPLFRSFRRLGAFALGMPPRVHGFPVLRLLCPIRLSPVASSFRETFPPHYFPTALPIHRGLSRVQPGRLKWNEGGGVLLLVPSAHCGSPVFAQRVGQVDLCNQGHTSSAGWPWSLLSPLVSDFRLNWLTY
jgi:hypothetical protein